MGKYRILIVVDSTLWVIGDIAKQIKHALPDLSINIVSIGFCRKFSAKARLMMENSCLVHIMLPYDTENIINNISGPVIVTLHHCVKENESKIHNLKNVDAVHVVSEEWKRFLKKKLGLHDNVHMIPNPVDTDFFISFSEKIRIDARKRYNIDSDSFVIGFFGKETHDLRKGTDFFYKILRRLVLEIKKIVVVLTGLHDENFINSLRELNIQVQFSGNTDKKELPALYALLDCYLITSRLEGGPVTLLEAMSSCVPVVTTNVGIVDEIIDADSNLLDVLEFNNVEQAVCYLKRILFNNNRDRNSRCIQRKFIKKNFSVSVIAGKYRKLYMKYLDAGKKCTLHDSVYQKAFMDSVSCDYYLWFENEIMTRSISAAECRKLYIKAFKHSPLSFYPYLMFLKAEKDNCFFMRYFYLMFKTILSRR